MSLPKNAKIVYKGEIFTIYNWEQKLYDGSTTIFEAIERPDTVKIIATQGDKIIITEESQPHLDYSYINLPGGRSEKGEDILESAKRELLEETGMKAKNRKLFKKYSMPGKMIWNSYFFIAQDCYKIQEPNLDAGEKIKLHLWDFEDFIDFFTNQTKLTYSESNLIVDILKIKLEKNIYMLKKEIFG